MSPLLENVRSGQSRTTRLTMVDIARLAGVDVSTVSRARADSARVTDETKERIRKIVKEKGYVVNQGARMLRNDFENGTALDTSKTYPPQAAPIDIVRLARRTRTAGLTTVEAP